MKKHFLSLNILLVICLTWSHIAVAKKRYRYIKREHGAKFHLNLNDYMTFSPSLSIPVNVGLAYAYNWKGMMEFGPYFDIKGKVTGNGVMFPSLGGGLLVEYNIIKNRGKRKFIPAIGLDLGFHKGEINSEINQSDTSFYLAGGPYGALKIFAGKRTPLTVTLGYKLFKPLKTAGMYHAAKFAVGFSYYFDFY